MQKVILFLICKVCKFLKVWNNQNKNIRLQARDGGAKKTFCFILLRFVYSLKQNN